MLSALTKNLASLSIYSSKNLAICSSKNLAICSSKNLATLARPPAQQMLLAPQTSHVMSVR
jgi:hypothetical protein